MASVELLLAEGEDMTKALAKWEPTSAVDVAEALHRITLYLKQATDVTAVDALRADAATVETLTRQRDLGHEAELAAAEIVRRCERKLGELYVLAQSEGRAARRGENVTGVRGKRDEVGDYILPKQAFFGKSDGGRSGLAQGAVRMASVNDDDFEDALTKAREAGTMARAAVLRAIDGDTPAAPREPRRRKLKSARIITETIHLLDGIAASLAIIDPELVTDAERHEWAEAMGTALAKIDHFRKGLAR